MAGPSFQRRINREKDHSAIALWSFCDYRVCPFRPASQSRPRDVQPKLRIRNSNTSDSCNFVLGGQRKGVVSDHTGRIGEPGSPRRTWVVFPMDEVCGVLVLLFFSRGFTQLRFWGMAFGKAKGETGREVLGWIFLFLLTTQYQRFPTQATAFFCLFPRPLSLVLSCLVFSIFTFQVSISVDGAREGGTSWKGVGRVYGLWTRSSLPSNCLASEPAATCKIALNDGQASICWETSFGPALFLFSSLFTVQFKTGPSHDACVCVR